MALLEMRDITKVFPGVVANDHVSFDLQPGEVHALVGENGAGKTTLMKILYGLYRPDGGSVSVRDQEVEIDNPKDAIRKGIGMVHQHFMLVPVFTVLENIILGEEHRFAGETAGGSRAERGDSADHGDARVRTDGAGRADGSHGGVGALLRRLSARLASWLKRTIVLDFATPRRRIAELMDQNRLYVDVGARVEDLAVGLQQRVEILKILYRGAEILVFDEPTAVLTPQESQELFTTFRRLTEQGKGVVFISHKLDEVLTVADRITVIRDGHVVETMHHGEATKPRLAELMVGKPVLLSVDNPEPEPGEVVLEVTNLSYRNQFDVPVFSDVNFEVREGEIFGIAGVEGNGQSELLRAIAEQWPLDSGDILLDGRSITSLDVRKRREAGIAHIPEDRNRFGLIAPFTVAENLSLGRHHRPPFVSNLQFIQRARVREFARQAIGSYDIRTPSETVPTHALSGGNQQKLIIAREMSAEPRLLLASQPTRGVDVGAQEFIYRQIVEAKKKGKAVLLVSADLDEVMSLADRIGVIYKGRIIKFLDRRQTTKEQVGFYMMGEQEHEAVPG